MNQNEALANTLAMVNIARQAYGHQPLAELPNARPGASADCLYARAMSDVGVTSVGGNGSMSFTSSRVAEHVAALWGTTAEGATVTPPADFAAVIGQFDRNGLPHYGKKHG